METVKILHCSKTYPGPIEAVRDFSLELKKGELVVLIGPSGCGKTTVLQMIAGLTEKDRGEILIDDHPLTRQSVAIMFQDSALFPWLTARENISFGLRKKGLDPQEIRSRVENIATRLQIHDLLDRKVRTFSGGQKQRVSLARACCREADLLLMDEPFSALDRQLRLELQQQILTLCHQNHQTVLMVTHDQNEALNMADRVVVMNEGKIIQTGTASQLINEPVNTFTAAFVGENEMNLWTVDNRILGVRPEHLKTEPESCDLRFKVRITDVQFNGLVYRTSFLYDGQQGLMISEKDPGNCTELGCSKDHVLYFDQKTGNRIL